MAADCIRHPGRTLCHDPAGHPSTQAKLKEEQRKQRAAGHLTILSSADLPMISICDTASVVNPRPALETLAGRNGWRVLRPQRPWESQFEKALRVLALLLAPGGNPAKL